MHQYELDSRPIILGVANTWDKRKGLNDFIQLAQLFSGKVQIVLVGLSKSQIASLPENIKGIPKTKSIEDLAALYASATVFVNPTTVDNFPTTNIESLACGTPVITYNTGGSPEAIDDSTGCVADKGDVQMLFQYASTIIEKGKDLYSDACRTRAINFFNKSDRYNDYLGLYQKILNIH
ncbi:MAG TPA: glycosyltransferase [Ferruginibacter sp.]|nr:glycosyltransferase [Ferruginibacter sp.]HMP19632.1 glycosyltransferase [Ferruginibacter sp.]